MTTRTIEIEEEEKENVRTISDDIAEIAVLKNAGLENDGRNRKGGQCRTEYVRFSIC